MPITLKHYYFLKLFCRLKGFYYSYSPAYITYKEKISPLVNFYWGDNKSTQQIYKYRDIELESSVKSQLKLECSSQVNFNSNKYRSFYNKITDFTLD